MKRSCIVSVAADFHATVVASTFERRTGVACPIFDLTNVDLSRKTIGTFALGGDVAPLLDVKDRLWPLDQFDRVWFRRFSSEVRAIAPPDYSSEELAFAGGEYHSFISQLFRISFVGQYIDHPVAMVAAQDKMRQLMVAHDVGFDVPQTIVSNSYEDVRLFVQKHGDVVVKPLSDRTPVFIPVRLIDHESLERSVDRAIVAMFQRCIHGEDHLRVNVFGEEATFFRIRTSELDWRHRMKRATIEPVPADQRLTMLMQAYLGRLNLSMGIFDFKIGTDGRIYFLECNPQGQFLFLEPYAMSKTSLLNSFVEFLAAG